MLVRMTPKYGGTCPPKRHQIAGYVTNASTKMFFEVPCPASREGMSASATVTSAYIRTAAGGYVLSGPYEDSISATAMDGYLILQMSRDSGFNVANNTPVAGGVDLSWTLS